MRNRIIACSHRWQVGKLPGWLVAFITAVIGADLIVIGTCAAVTRFRGADLELAAVLLACNLLTVELTHRAGEPAGLVKDVHAIWELPLALLLPPLYGLLVPIPRMVLVQWRVRATLVHRRVFTAAAVGLSYGAASAAFHGVEPVIAGSVPGAQARVLAWALAAAACGVLKSAVNKVLVMTAVKGADPAASVRAQLFTREPLFHDAAELSVGIMVARAATDSPFMALAALPLVALLHRSFRHAQLVDASRIDAKTGPAQRRHLAAGSPAGDRPRGPDPDTARRGDRRHRSLQERQRHVRAPDRGRRAGRHRRRPECTAARGRSDRPVRRRRVRDPAARDRRRRSSPDHGAGPREDLPDRHPGQRRPGARAGDDPLRVTISIGVAALGSSRLDLEELLAAADHALYQAKETGRNRVCLQAASPA